MKRIKIIATILISSSLFLASCDNHKEPESYKNFKTYAESVENRTEDNWKEFEVEYMTRQDAVERDMEQMSEMEKKEFKQMQAKYDSKKIEMEKKMAEIFLNIF